MKMKLFCNTNFCGVIWLLFVVEMISRLGMVMTCPTECTCRTWKEQTIVDCSKAPSIPSNVPCTTTNFMYSNSLLRRISGNHLPCQHGMKTLILENNLIAHISDDFFENLLELRYISLRGNRLTDFQSKPVLKELRHVDLSWNFFANWPTQFSHQLFKAFLFSMNPLEKPVVVPYRIEKADFRGLPVTELSSSTFLYPHCVASLYMSRGVVEVLGSLSGFYNLQILTVSFNRVRTIEPNSLKNLTHLEKLDLKNNSIVDISAIRNLPSLKEVDLQNNLITTLIESLSNIPRLEFLGLIGNRISLIPPISFTSLRSITLNLNVFTSSLSISRVVSTSPQLLNVNVGENNLTDLIIGECFILKSIFASKNSIATFTLDQSCSELNHIDLGYNKLSSLTGIQNLTKVESLYLHCNQINVWAEDGLTNLTKLRMLRLEKNSLREIGHLPTLPELTFLNLSHNSIYLIGQTSLSFPKLNSIDLTGNKLTRFPCLTNLPSLTVAYINSNRLLGIQPEDIGQISSLQRLHMARNRINTFPLLPINRINMLNVNYNNITLLEPDAFHNYQNLQHLMMAGNQVQGTPHFPPTLKRVYLDVNYIESTNTCLKYVPRDIEVLSLRGNKISSLTNEIHAGPSMKYLDLSYNVLLNVAPFIFHSAENLKTLCLQYNALVKMTAETLFGLTRINFISLQWNKINYLPNGCFSLCPRLTHLDITGNPLLKISDSALSGSLSLKYFTFSHVASEANLFSSVFSSHMSCLRYLSMTNNTIVNKWSLNSSFIIRAMVVDIDFSRNALMRTFPKAETPSLLRLDLSYNCFYSLPEQLKDASYPLLISLMLSWNKITIIEKDAFSRYLKLCFLFLDNNSIIVLQQGSFSTNNALISLDLSQNNLSVIHQDSLPVFGRKMVLDLSGNPWNCDCYMYAFTQWLWWVNIEGATCARPLELKQKPISGLRMDGDCDAGYENITCSVENPILFVSVGDIQITLPCPLDATNRRSILWELPSKLTLQTKSTSPFHPISVDENGSVILDVITEDLSGNYSCMAPTFGIWTAYSLTLVATAPHQKNSSADRSSNSFQASDWAQNVKCTRHSDQSEAIFSSIIRLILIVVSSAVICFAGIMFCVLRLKNN